MAKITTSFDPNRTKLSEVIPLDSPFAMYVEPTRTCNFKCFYCMHSTRGEQNGALDRTGFRLGHMDMRLYEKVVRETLCFPSKVRRVTFSGLGEPLMNPKLPEMIQMLRTAGFEGRIDVITNGSLLTHELTDALIEAGMNRLQVSIQGLDRQQYLENCGVEADLDELRSELAYFYQKSRGTQSLVYVKIIDDMVKGPGERERFFQTYDDICDTMWVEHLVVLEKQMGDHSGRADIKKTLQNEPIKKLKTVCSAMFYYLNVGCDGEVFPCTIPGLPNSLSLGNVERHTLQEIWNGSRRRGLLCKNLRDGFASIPDCGEECTCVYGYLQDDSEYLDDCREELLNRIQQQGPGLEVD